jgi:hypothetical protein
MSDFPVSNRRHTGVNLRFTGDIMLGELLENYGRGVRTIVKQEKKDPFEHVRGELSKADLTVGNLECVLSNSSNRKGIFREILRAPAESISFLKNANFGVLSLANNHAMDHGRAALLDCAKKIEDFGIAVVGIESGRMLQRTPKVFEIKGVKIGVLAYNLANCDAGAFGNRMKWIHRCVQDGLTACDHLILLMHWGEEYTEIPKAHIITAGLQLLDEGVSVICGHHSHRLQGFVEMQGGVFAPSLGNFVFDDRRSLNRLTGILEVELDSFNAKSRLIPCYINSYFQPVVVPSCGAEIASLHQKLESAIQEVLDGQGACLDEIISRQVAAGHRWNRIRMRALMLGNFWKYQGFLRNIIAQAFTSDPGGKFSVSDVSEWAGFCDEFKIEHRIDN